tara:strand:- start:1014 stop:2198 length:1185 start_codon:yes stop_codon:yes gene_type:complete
MIFQTFDYPAKCKKVYASGSLCEEFPQNLSGTWEYRADAPSGVEFAKLYCDGKNIHDVCPEHLQREWQEITGKWKAHLNAFIQAKISLKEHCIYDLVPQHFLLDFCEVKNQITKYVLDNYDRPKNYNFLLELAALSEDIKTQPLNLKTDKLNGLSHQLATRNFLKRLKKIEKSIKYNIFGTKTGRLTTEPNSFPILTLKKEFRSAIEPNNDLFVELDFNAAELRTLLSLMDKEQPKGDIHDWNAKNVFRGYVTRKEAKERIFAWLYNPDSKDYLANRSYDRIAVKEKYWDGKKVKTPFGREIEADAFHALNYLIQSTTADMVLRQAIKVYDLLKDSKSYIAFMIHDSLVIDLAKEDKGLLTKVFEVFSQTDLGEFSISTQAGKSFGEMRKIKWT